VGADKTLRRSPLTPGRKVVTSPTVTVPVESPSTATRRVKPTVNGASADAQFADENFKLRHTGPGVLCEWPTTLFILRLTRSHGQRWKGHQWLSVLHLHHQDIVARRQARELVYPRLRLQLTTGRLWTRARGHGRRLRDGERRKGPRRQAQGARHDRQVWRGKLKLPEGPGRANGSSRSSTKSTMQATRYLSVTSSKPLPHSAQHGSTLVRTSWSMPLSPQYNP